LIWNNKNPAIPLESQDFFVSLPARNYKRDKIMEATVLNEAQLELLRMMAAFNTPEAVKDLKQAISDYFAQKADEELERLWDEGILTDAKVESFRTLHERTAYK
jgi:hypothetical protein